MLEPWRKLHIHEEPPRAHGGDPNDPLDCLPLTGSCHRKRTGDVGIGRPLTIEVVHAQLRCRGPLIFREHRGDHGDHWVTVPWSLERFPDVRSAMESYPL